MRGKYIWETFRGIFIYVWTIATTAISSRTRKEITQPPPFTLKWSQLASKLSTLHQRHRCQYRRCHRSQAIIITTTNAANTENFNIATYPPTIKSITGTLLSQPAKHPPPRIPKELLTVNATISFATTSATTNCSAQSSSKLRVLPTL